MGWERTALYSPSHIVTGGAQQCKLSGSRNTPPQVELSLRVGAQGKLGHDH